MTNPYEEMRRFEKADSLATMIANAHTHLDTDLSASEIAAAMSPAERARAADAAGVKVPSEKTWSLCVSLLRKREGVARATLEAVS